MIILYKNQQYNIYVIITNFFGSTVLISFKVSLGIIVFNTSRILVTPLIFPLISSYN